MRQRESTGRPLADKSFVEHLSALSARDVLPGKRSPKPKRKANNQAWRPRNYCNICRGGMSWFLQQGKGRDTNSYHYRAE